MSTYDPMIDGEIEIEGRMPWSSNATFLVRFEPPSSGDDAGDARPDEDGPGRSQPVKGIYKPLKGERPLWDYPTGLYRREAAAFELSALLGWDVIPRTVVRSGPHGVGSVQRFVDADFEQHYFTIRESFADLDPSLRRIAAFDVIANSGDRKSGHVLLDRTELTCPRVWGIDNGLSFHEEDKLRTVIWDFAGDDLAADLVADLERVLDLDVSELGRLPQLLSADETEMLLDRMSALVEEPQFPAASSRYAYPWPLV